jgi:hypothetical protein
MIVILSIIIGARVVNIPTTRVHDYHSDLSSLKTVDGNLKNHDLTTAGATSLF